MLHGPRSWMSAISTLALLLAATTAVAAQDAAGSLNFRHTTHRMVQCTGCHERGGQQIEAPTMTLRDCQSCHHATPTASNCLTCHASDDARRITRQVNRTVDLSLPTAGRTERMLPFAHNNHEAIRCQTCHTEGVGLSASNLSCTGCHEDHHRPTATCGSCHEPPAPGVHDRGVHVTCSGAGCHQSMPAGLRSMPRTRTVCLSCHTGMTYHKPGETCTNCHALPPPEQGGG